MSVSRPLCPLLAFALVLAVPIATEAQVSALQLEVNGGAAFPVQELSGPEGFEDEASTDTTFGVHFALTSGRITYLVGFSEHRFGCPAIGCGGKTNFVSTAWDLAVRLNLRREGVVPWLRLGTVAALVQADFTASGEPSLPAESDRGWGFEAGAGVLIPVATRLALNPGVRYGRVDVDFPTRGELAMRYLVVDLGLVLGF